MISKIFVSTLVFASSAFAMDTMSTMAKSPYDVIAPIMGDEPVLADRVAGQIFYEVGSGLKVVNPSGGIEVINNTGSSPVTSGNSGRRVESVKVSASGVVTDESSDWVNGNCVVASGITTCTWQPGIFSSTPNCVATNNNMPGQVDATQIDGSTASTTILKITTHRYGTGNVASPYQIICMGPQ